MLSLAAKLLADWRKEKGLTQKDAAALFGVSQPMLSEYEDGKKVPRTLLALKIEQVTEGRVRIATWGEYAPEADVQTESAASSGGSGEHPAVADATGTDDEGR
jgi:transcriptional regulator with XRE-family HTH domain